MSIFSRDDPTLPTEPSSASEAPTERRESMTPLPATEESQGLLSEYRDSKKGNSLRAAEAYVRPYPMATHGDLISYCFDLKSSVFDLVSTASADTPEDAPTEVFLPDYHFPRDAIEITVSSGRYSVGQQEVMGVAVQVLRWWPDRGEQKLHVKGSTQRAGMQLGGDEDGTWLDRCRESICSIM